jgi:spore maturation protein CgeB
MRILCVFGRHNYGQPARGEAYEFRTFIPALRALGHEVRVFDSWDRSAFDDFVDLNSALLSTVDKFRPDVVLAVPIRYEVWTETWDLIRATGAVTINWAADDSWKYEQHSRLVATTFDVCATTNRRACGKYLRDGFDHAFLTQWAAPRTKLIPPKPADLCKYAVTFVGTAHGDRWQCVDKLRALGLVVLCFGHGWPGGAVTGEELDSIVRDSVISINFANAAGSRRSGATQLKARVFEIPGGGGFLLTEGSESLDEFFRLGKEIAVFTDLRQLAEIAHYYLSHHQERDAVAAAGFERVRTEHTYEARFDALLSFATARHRIRITSPKGSVDWRVFAAVAERHRTNHLGRALRFVFLRVCSAVWGPQRGRRAARTALFELSWRLLGARTYSAAGLPGRLFYGDS